MNQYSPPERLEKRHVREGFSSGAAELDEWLAKYSWQNQRANNAITYVSSDLNEGRVAGYYAITVSAVARTEAPSDFAKDAPRQIGCALLARLAVDKTSQGSGLGTALLTDCLRRSAQLSEQIGLKALLVHCRDQAARDFYLKRADFQASVIDEMQLILPMKWITARLR